MQDDYLDKIYTATNPDEQKGIYDDWSETYDADLKRGNYATPARCAEALARFVDRPDTPVLDFGCGTGMSGEALHAAGFTTVDGVDVSEGMIAQAGTKGVYRTLTVIGPEDPVPTGYMAITAMGVIGTGAAPASALTRVVGTMPKGGVFVFSFNDHTLEDPAYTGLLDDLMSSGTVIKRAAQHGPHLPDLELGAIVYVIEKT